MATRIQRRRFGITAVPLALAVLLAVNLLAGLIGSRARIDLTDNNVFSLSQGTRNILASLDEPIELRLFLSRDGLRELPALGWHVARVQGLLDEYSRRAGGNLTVKFEDPEPFSEAEDRAVAYGLSGVPVGGEGQFYFGLVGESSVGAIETIPFFSEQREQYLEYDLTRLIHRLANPTPPTVGLVSGLPMQGGEGQPAWTVLAQVRESFSVREVQLDGGDIADDIGVLFIVQPPEWSEAALYALDQFVLGGGRVLLYVDSFSEALPPSSETAADVNPLLQQWGVKLAADKIAADVQRSINVQVQRDGRIGNAQYPLWMNLTRDELDGEDVISANLNNMIFATAGYFEAVADADVTMTPLATTTSRAAQYDRAKIYQGVDPEILLRDYQPLGRKLALAVRLNGDASSAFDGKVAEAEWSRPHRAESVEPINIIAVADADLLQDRFWVRVQNIFGAQISLPYAANGAFVVNALENLAGNNDLISVRDRPSPFRPFTLVQRIRSDADLRYRSKEKELLDSLNQAEARLRELEKARGDQNEALIDKQREAEIANYRLEKVRIRKELRAVRLDLRKDIENLETLIKFINIALIPLLIGASTVGFAFWRRRRTMRALRAD